MPIYEFRCQACGNISEFLMGMGGASSLACKNCGSADLERVISPAAISTRQREPGHTCCGREERCETPPCSLGNMCPR